MNKTITALIAAFSSLIIISSCDDAGKDTLYVSASGDAMNHPGGFRIEGAQITVLEYPEMSSVTNSDGYFHFYGIESGKAATFVFKMEGYPEVSTKTFYPGEEDLDKIVFQAPKFTICDELAAGLETDIDWSKCQMASTVTEIGMDLYSHPYHHGVAGASVTIVPDPGPEYGPVYFNSMVKPVWDQALTSTDGGVLFINVPDGVYTIDAYMEGSGFEEIEMNCRPGVFVNAAPPHGLQRY